MALPIPEDPSNVPLPTGRTAQSEPATPAPASRDAEEQPVVPPPGT